MTYLKTSDVHFMPSIFSESDSSTPNTPVSHSSTPDKVIEVFEEMVGIIF